MIRLKTTKPNMIERQQNASGDTQIELLYADTEHFLVVVRRSKIGSMHQKVNEDIGYRVDKSCMEPWLCSKNHNLFEFFEIVDN